MEVTIFQNEFFILISNELHVYIMVNAAGMTLPLFKEMLEDYPTVSITHEAALNNALTAVSGEKTKFGHLRERIEVSISHDMLIAYVTYNLTQKELGFEYREKLIQETGMKLKEKCIVFGIKRDLFRGELIKRTKYIIAQGEPPKDGSDAVITMFELKEAKPKVSDEEKLDFYDVSLITTVGPDSWLGECINATQGIPGTNILGLSVPAFNGIQYHLQYDKKSVYELQSEGKSTLYSREYGAIYYKGAEIALMNPLVIDGDVDFKTGNIFFDGFVIIQGTICDGFYVEATKDIEVHGEIGLGNIRGIVSKSGSIFVKGGIFSKGTAKVEAAKNIYIKFAENVDMTCGEALHVGIYCTNCNLSAREVILDSDRGKIMGGVIKADARVIAPFIGSEIGKKTVIEIKGFNKKDLMSEVHMINDRIAALKSEYTLLKSKILSYSASVNVTEFQHKLYLDNKKKLEAASEDIKVLTEKLKSYKCFLETRGDGEIKATRKIFPNTSIKIKKALMDINESKLSVSIFSKDGVLTIL